MARSWKLTKSSCDANEKTGTPLLELSRRVLDAAGEHTGLATMRRFQTVTTWLLLPPRTHTAMAVDASNETSARDADTPDQRVPPPAVPDKPRPPKKKVLVNHTSKCIVLALEAKAADLQAIACTPARAARVTAAPPVIGDSGIPLTPLTFPRPNEARQPRPSTPSASWLADACARCNFQFGGSLITSTFHDHLSFHFQMDIP